MTHLLNKDALNGGLYFHTSEVGYQTEKGISFPGDDGKVWFPQKAVHVEIVCDGRVDVWVAEWFIDCSDKEYSSIEGPEVPGSSLPSPSEPTTVV